MTPQVLLNVHEVAVITFPTVHLVFLTREQKYTLLMAISLQQLGSIYSVNKWDIFSQNFLSLADISII